MKKIRTLLCLVWGALVAGMASAGVTLVKSGGNYRITVPQNTVNRAGTVTLVWDTSDKGNTLEDWTNQRDVTTALTAAGVTVTTPADGIPEGSVVRAFVTETVKFLTGAITVPQGQWIDTGVAENTAYGLDMGVNVLSKSGAWAPIISGTRDKFTIGCNNGSLTSFYLRYNGTDTKTRPTITADKEGGNIIVIRNKKLTVNGTAISITSPSTQVFYANGSNHIFLNKDNWSTLRTSAEWYYVRLLDANNVCTRDLWPAQIGSEVGLWDWVEGKFYGGSGTGTITATGDEKESCAIVRGISATAADVASGTVATATWTGAATDRDPENSANWECRDLDGNVLTGALPTDDTAVTLSGAVDVDFPASYTLRGKSFAMNMSLGSDAAWRGFFSTTAVGEELPYVDVEAGAYVNTGFKPTALTHAVMDVTVQAELNTREYWFGVYDVNYTKNVFAVCNNAKGIYSGWSNASGDNSNRAASGRHTVELDRGKVIVDGTTIRTHTGTAGFPISNPLCLFIQRRGSTPTYGDGQKSIRFHGFKLYENDVLVLDYVPVRRASDGKLGIYDRVSQTFATIYTGTRSSASTALAYGSVHYPAADGALVSPIADVTPLPEGATVDLAGHTLTWSPSGTTANAATITSSTAGGDLVLDIAEDTEFNNTQVLLSGSLKVEKRGLGTWTATKVGQTYTGGTDIETGTAVTGGAASDLPFGGKQVAATGVSVIVREGATLDLNGQVGWAYTALTLDGGTATGSSLKPNFALNLTADSLITATGDLGSTTRSGITPNLNGHTLTLDVAAGQTAYLQGVTGAGTIVAKGGGTVTTWTSFADAVLTLDVRDVSLVLGHDITVSNYLSSCETVYSAGEECVSVSDTFRPTTTHFSGVVLEDGSTLDLRSWTSAWSSATQGTGSDNTSVLYADNATVTIDLRGRTLAKGDQIVAWTALPANDDTLSFKWDDETATNGIDAVVTASGIFYGADPASTVVDTAQWTNAAGDGDFSNPANWICKNAAGRTIDGALPTKTVTVTISGDVNSDFPASAQVFPGRALMVNARLTGDVDWSKSVFRRTAVPAEYVFIKTGAYFDTQFYPNQNSAVSLDLTVGGSYETWSGTWNANYCNGAFSVCNDGASIYAGYGNQGGGYGTPLAVGERHTVALDKGVLSIDGTNTVKTFTANTFQCLYPFLIGAQNRCGQASSRASAVCLHGAKIYDNGTLVRDYIPIRFEDGTGALYEKISGTCLQPTIGSPYISNQGITGTGEVTPHNGSVEAGPASGTEEYVVVTPPVFAEGSSFDLNGHALTLSGAVPPSGAVAITDDSAGKPGTLKFDVPENATFWNSRISIDGNLKFVKTGAGIFSSYLPLTYAAGTEIEAGIYRFSGGYATSAASTVFVNGETPAGAENTTITVRDGATLDLWAHEALDYTYAIEGTGVGDKGALVSSRNYYSYHMHDVIHDVTLTGDAKIGTMFTASKRTWTLNGHTLTLAKNDTFLADTEFTGEGTIVADGGSGKIEPYDWEKSAEYVGGFIATNAAFEVRSGTQLSLKGSFHVKDFTHAGSLAYYSTDAVRKNYAAYVSGRYTPVSATQPPVVFTGASGILDLSQATDTIASTLVDPGEGTNTTVYVDLGTRKASSKTPLLSWTQKPERLTFRAHPSCTQGFAVREDGLYVTSPFVIFVN